ncbi:hypothetical protein CXB51_006823 [Gossypium anomalum]|uniref:Uncharacterized protein n=1 Tax=Gossypium anomalum TaxID=47600 RepID=A0A8J5ZAU0_9ROSI|nr:hypothetical protein CXB51_007040 [Gossypium anomalum]KAG8498300.1 hypothetical protein CXB51_006823 [Gossypium anomalum]
MADQNDPPTAVCHTTTRPVAGVSQMGIFSPISDGFEAPENGGDSHGRGGVRNRKKQYKLTIFIFVDDYKTLGGVRRVVVCNAGQGQKGMRRLHFGD